MTTETPQSDLTFTPQPLAARGIVIINTGGRAGVQAGIRADKNLSTPSAHL